ncbi:MAG: MFS transporter [Planctomycetaceae bacterium]|nr:MFS transporter [Planctomycetales bacterium]MCB9874584.1 MFS transporter [Planctomycetaceae bacterium]MCB9938650.1 MFS transporter [Planctomycetaceae bacterium]
MSQERSIPGNPPALSKTGCTLVLVTAFLGWMCAGWQLAISSIAMRDAAKDLLPDGSEADVAAWFGRLTCAFLLGAAFGGYVFGVVGDRFGRAKAMGFAILWYSGFSAATVFVADPWQLWAIRFLTCMGVGGMWPNGIALVSEAWPNISRPFLAGAIGTAANFGIMLLSGIASWKPVTVDDWHWIMWFGATPFALGLLVLFAVPESPHWLALGNGKGDGTKPKLAGIGEIFKRPLLATTLLGIALGTIPLFGGWGCSNWAMPWAADVGTPELKAHLSLARSLPGTISSLLGGGIAMLIGRRRAYFLASLGSLVSAQVLFLCLTPDGDHFWFIFWFASLGFFSGFFFGWLPLCLPELFPTRVRATGAGVSFNWGRIATAVGVVASGELLRTVFHGNYSQVGSITGLIYVAGMVVIVFTPDTSQRTLQE